MGVTCALLQSNKLQTHQGRLTMAWVPHHGERRETEEWTERNQLEALSGEV